MRMRNAPLGILLAASAAVAGAQAPTTTSTQVTSVRAAAPAGFRADYVAEVDDVGKKLIDLAQAMPADKYGWRPAPGVRSVRLHEAAFAHTPGNQWDGQEDHDRAHQHDQGVEEDAARSPRRVDRPAAQNKRAGRHQ